MARRILRGDERSQGARAFLQELAELCDSYGFVLSHEDAPHGAFFLIPRDTLDKKVVATLQDCLSEAYEEVP